MGFLCRFDEDQQVTWVESEGERHVAHTGICGLLQGTCHLYVVNKCQWGGGGGGGVEATNPPRVTRLFERKKFRMCFCDAAVPCAMYGRQWGVGVL